MSVVSSIKKSANASEIGKGILTILCAVAFVSLMACSDDSSESVTNSIIKSSADVEVDTYSELPSCAEKREGETAFVMDSCQAYICHEYKWVEYDSHEIDGHYYYCFVELSLTPKVGTFVDSRDGKKYRTVSIVGSTQTWMTENLNYETANSYCYDDDASNCAKYGRLYLWSVAMDSAGTWSTSGKGCGSYGTCNPAYPVRGVCPAGWHLPSLSEWNTLFAPYGGAFPVRFISEGENESYPLSALPAGYRGIAGGYFYEGYAARFWSSTENGSQAYFMSMDRYDSYASLDYGSKENGFSVRCVKDYD